MSLLGHCHGEKRSDEIERQKKLKNNDSKTFTLLRGMCSGCHTTVILRRCLRYHIRWNPRGTDSHRKSNYRRRRIGKKCRRRDICWFEQLELLELHSRALKTSHMLACECIICDNRPLSLCHEPPNDQLEKAQKEPHGAFEVICGSSEHDIYWVSEKTLVEVPSQTMDALAEG